MMPANCEVPNRLPRSASKRFLQRSRVADTAFEALSGSSSMASRTSSANSPNWWCSFGSMHRSITKGRCTPSTASSSVCSDNDLLCQSSGPPFVGPTGTSTVGRPPASTAQSTSPSAADMPDFREWKLPAAETSLVRKLKTEADDSLMLSPARLQLPSLRPTYRLLRVLLQELQDIRRRPWRRRNRPLIEDCVNRGT